MMRGPLRWHLVNLWFTVAPATASNRESFCEGKGQVPHAAGGASRLHRSVFDEDLFCDGHDRVTLVHCVRQELDRALASSTGGVEPAIVIRDSFFPSPEEW